MKPFAFLEYDRHAVLGPLSRNWTLGEVVELPTRKHSLLGHEIQGDTFIVLKIEPDGAAWAQRKSVYDADQAAA